MVLDPGRWCFVVMHEEGRSSKPKEIAITQDMKNLRLEIFRAMGTPDKNAGTVFFWGLVDALVFLIGLYITLHLIFPQTQSFFWKEEPLRFAEVLFWAIAGVLVNVLITSGSYLRWNSFYREGIIMHVSHLITAPLMVLVTVFLLSLFTLNLTLVGNNEITLDLSDPRILVTVSFLLGSRPWSIYNLLQSAASRLTRQEN